MRVLLITETVLPQVGGGETQAAMLAEGLVCRGHEVTLLGRHSIPETAREEQMGYRVLRVAPTGRGRWRKWGLLLTLPRFLPRLLDDIDVLVVSGFRLIGLPAVRAARQARIPVILKADSPGEWSGEFFAAGLRSVGLERGHWLIRHCLNWRNRQLCLADAFVAMGDALSEELQEGGIPRDRIHHIPNGVDVARFTPASPEERALLKTQLGLPAGPVITAVGRLVRYKGLHTLLKAWQRVSATYPGATLAIVGEGGADLDNCETELRTFVRMKGLEASVLFAGSRDDVAPWLKASDGFVFASTREAFGLALIEAMGCGLHVITTPVGAIAPYLQDGVNASIVPVGDSEKLSLALKTLLANRGDTPVVGAAARRVVLEHFSAHAVIDKWEGLLTAVARGPGA